VGAGAKELTRLSRSAGAALRCRCAGPGRWRPNRCG
jgi:hypothetical protein